MCSEHVGFLEHPAMLCEYVFVLNLGVGYSATSDCPHPLWLSHGVREHDFCQVQRAYAWHSGDSRKFKWGVWGGPVVVAAASRAAPAAAQSCCCSLSSGHEPSNWEEEIGYPEDGDWTAPRNQMSLIKRKYSKEVYIPCPSNFLSLLTSIGGFGRD